MAKFRHAHLLAVLVGLLCFGPLVQSDLLGLHLMDVMVIGALLLGARACSSNHRQMVVASVLAVAAGSLRLALALNGSPELAGLFYTVAIGFFGFVASIILRGVFDSQTRVSQDTICGALSVYLLFGLVWAFAFSLLELSSPGSFSGLGLTEFADFGHFKRFLGFSYVTLTTLGYGNISPATPPADSLAATEAIVGQLYLTVLVARLVALELLDRKSPLT